MSVFQFKQFAVDQAGCAMKVNTDGVLLGALASAEMGDNILDIGTGTGVIALMLAQRISKANIDAIEIDDLAAATALKNFAQSPFKDRLKLFQSSFQDYFKSRPDTTYNLIISNPPFHLNSLQSSNSEKAVARHAGNDFFTDLITSVPKHLNTQGMLTLVLPEQAASLVKTLAGNVDLYLQDIIKIQSYPHSLPHRYIVSYGFSPKATTSKNFIIYSAPKVYSAQYRTVLSNFLTIF